MYNYSNKTEGLGSINYQELYKSMKSLHMLDSKRIKKLLFYNYINDSKESVIYDCREKNCTEYFPQVSEGARLILILNDSDDLKKSPHLEIVRKKLQESDKIVGLFHILDSDFKETITHYPFLLMKNIIHLPLCVLNDILYIGGFINSKNKQTIELLKIKTIVSLMKEPDKELSLTFGDNYRNFEHEEVGHDEIDFNELSDYILKQIYNKLTPVLLYCFSGKTSSLAGAAVVVMKFKKWPLDLSLGYIMKLSPTIDIPSWLYTQLMRYKEKEELSQKKKTQKILK